MTVKFDANGQRQWIDRYSSPRGHYARPTSIVVNGPKRTVTIVGMAGDIEAGPSVFTTISLDLDGARRWVRYGQDTSGPTLGYARAVGTDEYGDSIVVGTVSRGLGPGGAPGISDMTILRYSIAGDVVWKGPYTSATGGGSEAFALTGDNLHHTIVAGRADTGGNVNIVTSKYSFVPSHYADPR